MKHISIFFFQFAFVFATSAQLTKSALFLGNSYTAYNNLPAMTSSLATSVGDVLIYNSNTPGGYTFEGHSTNTTSINLMQQGTWDYVILQEQSQLPSFPESQVESDCYPYAAILNDMIKSYNPCAETMFYMTWGRKTGDAGNCPNWPPVCTYEGMDDLLAQRYMQMAADNNAVVSPVGKVWRYLRDSGTTIELYNPDNSHPSVAGTYAAACCFYTAIFQKDPLLITDNQGLSAADAQEIREAVKQVVYDDLLTYNIGYFDLGPTANFELTQADWNTFVFSNMTSNASSVVWDFGDGTTSTELSPTHIFQLPGTYTVTLTATGCGIQDDEIITVNVTELDVDELNSTDDLNIYPNPSNDILFAKMESGEKMIKIRSLLGQIVFESKTNEEAIEFDLKDLASGSYVFEVELNGQILRKQFVKK